MDDLYREQILEHSRHPHNAGVLEQPDVSHEEHNPLCGDRIRIDMRIADGVIADIRFQGRGCAISQAAASLLTDAVLGQPLEDARRLGRQDLLDLIGIPLERNPVRLKCALLSLKTLKTGIYEYLGTHLDEQTLDEL